MLRHTIDAIFSVTITVYNMASRKLSGPRRDQVTREWRRLRNVELVN
jgi:hypothetical protein